MGARMGVKPPTPGHGRQVRLTCAFMPRAIDLPLPTLAGDRTPLTLRIARATASASLAPTRWVMSGPAPSSTAQRRRCAGVGELLGADHGADSGVPGLAEQVVDLGGIVERGELVEDQQRRGRVGLLQPLEGGLFQVLDQHAQQAGVGKPLRIKEDLDVHAAVLRVSWLLVSYGTRSARR